MKAYSHVIIGGGIAGVTAAETIRKHDSQASIAVISKEPHVLYSRVLLPHFLKKKIPREKLFLRSEDDFTKQRIDLLLNQSAAIVRPEHREVELASGMVLSYKTLVIATGGQTKEWGTPEDQNIIYRLQTLDDADRLWEALGSIKKPCVVGSSFISLEFLEIFSAHECTPLLLARDPHFFFGSLDKEGSMLIEKNCIRNGVEIVWNDSISEEQSDLKNGNLFTNGLRRFEIDALAVGVGIDRNTSFLDNSGIAIGAQGVRTDEYLKTNTDNVFAAGDIAEFLDVLRHTQGVVGNWTNAALQGSQVGLNMLGGQEPFLHVPTYSITNFGLQLTFLGHCKEEGVETVTRLNESASQYERFFLKGGVLVGAILINMFRDKPHIAALIEKKVPLGEHEYSLGQWEFDVASIPI